MRKAKITELYRLYRSYRKDFPRAERAPALFLLHRIYIRKSLELVVFEDGRGRAVAYAVNFRECRHGCVLISFLATLEQYRSGGYGSRFIGQMREYYGDAAGLIVEIEQCGKGNSKKENDNRNRRRCFYEKNGFFMQKPRLILAGVEMNLMYLPIRRQTLDAPFDHIMYDIYTEMLGAKKRDQYVTFLSE